MLIIQLAGKHYSGIFTEVIFIYSIITYLHLMTAINILCLILASTLAHITL